MGDTKIYKSMMTCDKCAAEVKGVKTLTWYAGKHISTSKHTTLLHNETTVSRYRDLISFDIHICEKCTRTFRKECRKEACITFLKFFPISAVIGIVGFSLPQDAEFMGFVRMISAVALCGAGVLLVYTPIEIFRSHDRELTKQLASQKARVTGHDTTWTPKEYARLERTYI
ncbi:hypothetical protein JXO52_13755 [bacterium]|nr:hypothetical protein [bacterium]